MSVPLDRLYNYLQDIVKIDIVIYRWYPHGSKKPIYIRPLKHYDTMSLQQGPFVLMHDQEPLGMDQYSDQDLIEFKNWIAERAPEVHSVGVNTFMETLRNNNLGGFLPVDNNQPVVVVHSEQNSNEVKILESTGHFPVYYWSHALLARDWYRYAEHDPKLSCKELQQTFLIYSRAWSGTREYRLKFSELLVDNDMVDHCRMSFSPTDSDRPYTNHVYKNPIFAINTQLENYFSINHTESDASADYCTQDYQATKMEVVLETLFDDHRWHLTEKILRPIACGHPFILVSTPGSLRYLRSYGFKTFDDVIDESYDNIVDPLARLKAVVEVMKHLLSADAHTWSMLKTTAEYNKSLFFSAEFQRRIVDEFSANFDQALFNMTPSQSGSGGLST